MSTFAPPGAAVSDWPHIGTDASDEVATKTLNQWVATHGTQGLPGIFLQAVDQDQPDLCKWLLKIHGSRIVCTHHSVGMSKFVGPDHDHLKVCKFLKTKCGYATFNNPDIAAYVWAAMDWAATCGSVETLKFLKSWGMMLKHIRACYVGNADPEKYKISPLTWSAEMGHVCILAFMKSWKDCAPDGTVDCLTLTNARAAIHTAIYRAAMAGRVKALRFLKDWRDPGSEERVTLNDLRVDGSLRFSLLQMTTYYQYRQGCNDRTRNVLEFLKAWTDVTPDGTRDRITTEDLCADRNKVLRRAAGAGNLYMCRFLLDWLAELKQ